MIRTSNGGIMPLTAITVTNTASASASATSSVSATASATASGVRDGGAGDETCHAAAMLMGVRCVSVTMVVRCERIAC
eukprot:1192345-Prorocentrum_minimum.AAC.1